MMGLVLILLAVVAIPGLLGFGPLSRAALTGAKVLAALLLVHFGVVAIAAGPGPLRRGARGVSRYPP